MKPDFDSVIISRVNLPYDPDRLYLQATYTDPLLAGWTATMIEDTVNITGSRLCTVIWRFPRAVLAEVNTHRVFSRNSASSRARSMKTTIEEVLNDPYIPLFTKNQKGMSGHFLDSAEEWEEAKKLHLYGRDNAVKSTLALLLGEQFLDNINNAVTSSELMELADYYHKNVYLNNEVSGLSLHKQVANRALEPYMWHESVVTSSYWENFIRLRVSDSADPAIYALAVLQKHLMDASVPRENGVHVPFATESMISNMTGVLEADMATLMECASNAAQISYVNKSHANSTTGNVNLGFKLKEMEHWSPFEHLAYGAREYAYTDSSLSGNLHPSWVQFRRLLDHYNNALDH